MNIGWVGVAAVRTCRVKTTLVTSASENTVREPPGPSRKLAGAGVAALIWSRTCSSSAVTLCVVKRLAATTSLRATPAGSLVEECEVEIAEVLPVREPRPEWMDAAHAGRRPGCPRRRASFFVTTSR